jgi:hypothetical protein
MPFDLPCFAPEFFFDAGVLSVIHGVMGASVVADQWGCDVPVLGSHYQEPHVDYQRPLFAETPDLVLPPGHLKTCDVLFETWTHDGYSTNGR